jgi:eukaryotic-like serine/threonine-protein kinase
VAVRERTVPADIAPLAEGDPAELGPYTLLGRLGSGGMGLVYLGRAAQPQDTEEFVAIKTLQPAYANDPEVRQRFRAEAAYARRVASFCTARVIEDASDRPHPYLVTEFIQGPPLSQVVAQEGRLPAGTAQAVAVGVADALCTIHAAGLVHRDVKPANVLLAETGPRIIDFGIAHELDAAEGLTKAGVVMGSPGWIAPERLKGAPATPASDVFGWGLLVAYASTGRNPFGTGDPAHLAERILRLPPDLLGLREPLHSLVKAALAKDPALRPSAEDLLSALIAPMAEDTAALAVAELWEPPPRAKDGQAVTAPGRAQPRNRRRQAGLNAAGAAAAAAVTAVVMLGANPGAQADQPPQRIEVTVTATVPTEGGRAPQNAKGGDRPDAPVYGQRPSSGPSAAPAENGKPTTAPPARRPAGGGSQPSPSVTVKPKKPAATPTTPPDTGQQPGETGGPQDEPPGQVPQEQQSPAQ